MAQHADLLRDIASDDVLASVVWPETEPEVATQYLLANRQLAFWGMGLAVGHFSASVIQDSLKAFMEPAINRGFWENARERRIRAAQTTRDHLFNVLADAAYWEHEKSSAL